MSTFELIEFTFDPDDFSLQLEDEFLLAKITREIEAVEDTATLKEAALKLLQLAVQRQAVIRNLCNRLANLEANTIKKLYEE